MTTLMLYSFPARQSHRFNFKQFIDDRCW